MLSETLIRSDFQLSFWKAGIYNKPFWYKAADNIKDILWHSSIRNCFSDHFPVYIYLIKQK
jgi:hypothetical protein